MIDGYDPPTREYWWFNILLLLGQYESSEMIRDLGSYQPLDNAVQDLMDNCWWDDETADLPG